MVQIKKAYECCLLRDLPVLCLDSLISLVSCVVSLLTWYLNMLNGLVVVLSRSYQSTISLLGLLTRQSSRSVWLTVLCSVRALCDKELTGVYECIIPSFVYICFISVHDLRCDLYVETFGDNVVVY